MRVATREVGSVAATHHPDDEHQRRRGAEGDSPAISSMVSARIM